MPDIIPLLKKLLPNRLKAYEAIADEALTRLQDLLAADAALDRDSSVEPTEQVRMGHRLRAEMYSMLEAAGVEPGATEKQFFVIAALFFCRAARATLGMTPYRTQLVAGLALSDGYVLEMGTGEGKTLVAPFAAWLADLRGRRVHVVTANEYLAQRDATLMAPLYRALGLPVAAVLGSQDASIKRQAYAHPVVYGVASVFALDLLHDDQVVHPKLRVGSGLSDVLAIVDEVDQVLIDEAKNPVVFSRSMQADPLVYASLLALVEPLTRAEAPVRPGDTSMQGHFWLDLENHSAILTDQGYALITAELRQQGLLTAEDPDYGAKHQHLLHLVTVALGARDLLKREVHYTVRDGRIVLIDAITGRLLPGRRWDSGLQQFLEAKEGLAVSDEPIVLGRISLQNFFKLYGQLCGMSGTVLEDAEEFERVYGLRAVAVPPNIPSQRVDRPDVFARTQAMKVDVVRQEVVLANKSDRPVLIVVSDSSQATLIADALSGEGLTARVLTAANHSEEAQILSRAGELGAITIATSLAGRGVDIKLGGEHAMGSYLRRLYAAPRGNEGDYDPETTKQRAEQLIGEINSAVALYRNPGSGWLEDSDVYEKPFQWACTLSTILRNIPEESSLLTSGQEALTALIAVDSFRRHHAELFRHPEGLLVIGFEHFETARADQQLRGRAGRQGDPGTTVFLTSLDDTLLAETGSGEELRRLLHAVGAKPGDELEEKLVRKLILQEQRQAQGRAGNLRQQLVKFDAAVEVHRTSFQRMRFPVLMDDHGGQAMVRAVCVQYAREVATALANAWTQGGQIVHDAYCEEFESLGLVFPTPEQLDELSEEQCAAQVASVLLAGIDDALERMPAGEDRATFLRFLILSEMDTVWGLHLEEMTSLRRGIHLRGHAKQDPHTVFQKEAFALFESFLTEMKGRVRQRVLTWREPAAAVEQEQLAAG